MRKIKYSLFFIIVVLLLCFVYIVTYKFVEPKVYDFMTKNVLTQKLPFDNFKKVDGTNDIIIVVIDNETAKRYRWPWKRELFCKIFNYFLDYANPAIVVHDAILSTPDNEHPESDLKLYKTFSRFDNLVEGFLPNFNDWNEKDAGKIYDKKFAEKFSLKNITVQNPTPNHFYKSSVLLPKDYFDSIKELGSVAAEWSGDLNGKLSTDEILRTMEFVIDYNGSYYPSLALRTFLNLYQNPDILVTDNSLEFPDLHYKIKQKSAIINKHEKRWVIPLRFYRLRENFYTHNTCSAIDIMDSYDSIVQGKKPKIDPKIFENRIVIIGANVPASEGLIDSKNTPIDANHPGVDIQATAIDNIIHNEFLNILPIWFNILITVLGMLFVYFSIKSCELFKAISLTIGTIAIYLLSACICFYYFTVINIITPIVMFITTMIIAYIHRYITESKNKKKVENALGKYMSEDVMKRILQNIDTLGLGGKKAIVTVLFSDIRGFTSMSEKMSAEEVTAILNEYFSEMEPIVRKHGGIINKFIGDAIMAIFGEPIQNELHPQNAVKCAIEMLNKLGELQNKWQEEGKPKIEIGIGINTGEVFVGNIGSVNRMEYTVIGDTVNLASRLEGYNKTFDTKILVSKSTYEETKNIVEAREISDVEIRGKSQKMNIYEIINIKDMNNID